MGQTFLYPTWLSDWWWGASWISTLQYLCVWGAGWVSAPKIIWNLVKFCTGILNIMLASLQGWPETCHTLVMLCFVFEYPSFWMPSRAQGWEHSSTMPRSVLKKELSSPLFWWPLFLPLCVFFFSFSYLAPTKVSGRNVTFWVAGSIVCLLPSRKTGAKG